MCLPLDGQLEDLRGVLIELESYSVAVRYPGVTVSVAMAESALVAAEKVRGILRVILQA
jgi:hypothetical protein